MEDPYYTVMNLKNSDNQILETQWKLMWRQSVKQSEVKCESK